ncbi:hypothetical protein AHMF7616_03172 [Adhaeribacter pallidiroseus]|uniref:Malectin domain-containing protein n=1 Tax=Adhaeribacter pallidiroseus TaxID=2072847 RepID=A0A369QQV7_9BACT|nr:choice-of-anchor tandem repeat GloVer-containing protein [Adhaeribacter pallidiroseus]RDC64558.1 hypothetical protein AHMF7616_03172 [Adhaeribacter pallidiroseus]
MQGSDGNFYGTATSGGTYGFGTIYKITPGGTYTVLWNLDGTNDGRYSYGSLVQGSDGYLYGMTQGGGTYNHGTIFKINTSGTVFTVLKQLDYSTTGGSPYGSLVRGKDNNFYGMTYYGGSIGYGTVFKITSNGDLTVIKNFDFANGGYPFRNSLVQGADGFFYGMTNTGGASSTGVVFKISPNGDTFLVLRDFDSTTDGGYPQGDLVQGTDGRFYGLNNSGGINGFGTIFRISTSGTFQVLRHLNIATDGGSPIGSLVLQKANPTANAQSVTTAVNTAKAITLTGSGGSPVTYSIVASPAHGTLSGSGANRTYTPEPGYTGTDSFTFTVTWGCQTSSAKTVTITVGAPTAIRLNTGGPAVGSFSADNHFSGATSISTTDLAIANTTNDALYQDNRRATTTGGSFNYNIPVPNGVYTVKLHFAEVFFTTTGKRKFNVTAEGNSWLTNYDIYAAADGVRRAVVVTKNITVSGNTLNLNFVSTVDKACVSAIEVLPVAGAERLAEEVPTEAENTIILGLYPNPVHNQFMVQLSEPLDNPQTSVRDAAGVEVLHNPHQVISSDQLQVNVETLKPGLYLLQVHSKQGYQTMKFLKE